MKFARTILLPALGDTARFWIKVELGLAAFRLVRGIRRWTRVPLGDREMLIWWKIVLVLGGNARDWKDATEQIGG